MSGTFYERNKWNLPLSLVFLIPALLLVLPGLLYSLTGINLPDQIGNFLGPVLKSLIDSPWTILGGLFIAIALNALAVVHIEFKNNKDGFRTLIEIKKKTWNLLLLALAAFLGFTIIGYLLAENIFPLL